MNNHGDLTVHINSTDNEVENQDTDKPSSFTPLRDCPVCRKYGSTNNTNQQSVYGDKMIDQLKQCESDGIALAFPGGGIRGGAFCYGVLQYLIENEVKFHTICCVSGGGYTGAAFVQNVYYYMKKYGVSYEDACRRFFSRRRMARHSGFMCNCSTWYYGLLELFIYFFLLLTWVVLFVFENAPIWFILAVLADDLLGSKFKGPWSDLTWYLVSFAISAGVSSILYIFLRLSDTTVAARLINFTALTFVASALAILLIIIVKIVDDVDHFHSVDDLTLLGVLLLLLLLRPIFKRLAPKGAAGLLSLSVYMVFVSYVTAWRVYKRSLWILGPYSATRFNVLLFISGIVILFPIQHWQRSLLHHFYEWRLQKAFFLGTGLFGLTGPWGLAREGVTMGDLLEFAGKIPAYFGQTVLNGWKKNGKAEKSYHLVNFDSGTSMMKIVCYDDENDVSVRINHVRISTVMALSGAAIAYRMGAIENQQFRFWQIELGFGLGNWLFTKWQPKFLHSLILSASLCMFTLSVILIIFADVTPKILLAPFSVFALFTICAILFPPNWKYVEWIYNYGFLINVLQLLDLDIYGGDPLPLQVYISDGAHADNYPLLPLLENQRYHTIIVCDGTEDIEEDCDSFLRSLNLARTRLCCSFLPVLDNFITDEHMDAETAIKKFAECKGQTYLRLQVVYFNSQLGKHPERSPKNPQYCCTQIIYLKARREFAQKHIKDLDRLHGCCCETCHQPRFAFMSKFLGEYPQHSNINQFFTETLFDAYSDLGLKTAQEFFEKSANFTIGNPVPSFLMKY